MENTTPGAGDQPKQVLILPIPEQQVKPFGINQQTHTHHQLPTFLVQLRIIVNEQTHAHNHLSTPL